MHFETKCVTAVDFGSNRKYLRDFLSVINSNLGPVYYENFTVSSSKMYVDVSWQITVIV